MTYLYKCLALFNQDATERLEGIIQTMKVAQGITEERKSRGHQDGISRSA